MRARPEGIRITRVGFWYVLFTVIVGIAATNTGNNALYLVLAVMLGMLVLSGLTSRSNVRRLDVEARFPEEVFANRPFGVELTVTNGGAWLPRWLIVVSLPKGRGNLLVPHLPAGESYRGRIETMFETRGVHALGSTHLWSVFPMGFFNKGMRYPHGARVLVYPEIFSDTEPPRRAGGSAGEEPMRRKGWGHELWSLRPFRPGDDPRSVHWKQTARTGQLIAMEREAEQGQRLSILFDNAAGALETTADKERFETLVSEAATAATRYLERGFEVELITRERVVSFGNGRHQRHRILAALAVIESLPVTNQPMIGPDPRVPQLRLGMDRGEAVGT